MKERNPIVHAGVVSHIGCVRKNNEDNFYFDGDYMLPSEMNAGIRVRHTSRSPQQVYSICDGMGGPNSGERASYMAVAAQSALRGHIAFADIQNALSQYAFTANAAIYKDGLQRNSPGQGTTLALLRIQDDMAAVANLGDSRVYICRSNKLVQLSYDHTQVYKLFLSGVLTDEQARNHPDGNIITQFLGMPPSRMPEQYLYHRSIKLCEADRFLLCSDGLTDLIASEAILAHLTANPDPLEAACALVRDALELGGKDNVTCIVVDVAGNALPKPGATDLDKLSQKIDGSPTLEITR